MNRNVDKIIEMAQKSVDEHRLGPGKYCRWLWQDAKGDRNLDSSEYGCADAANILYMIGNFPRDLDERAASVAELRSFQREDGVFSEPTHHFLHSTAHCIAALELFDASPTYPLTYHLESFGTPEKLTAYLETLGWDSDPWSQSHRGAGLYAAMMLGCRMSIEWQDAYFKWLWDNCDPVTGIGRATPEGQTRIKPLQHHLNGWFHYMFNHVYTNRPFPNSDKLIDSCIDMYKNWDFVTPFGKECGFAEIDWIFALNRASRNTGYRREESLECLRDFAEKLFDFIEGIDTSKNDRFNDLHMLFGTMCAVAELQIALPGEIKTTVPLKNVLDRRPFI